MFISKNKQAQRESKAYQDGVTYGYEMGKIAGKAEAMGMGYILKGTRVQQELDEILKDKSYDEPVY